MKVPAGSVGFEMLAANHILSAFGHLRRVLACGALLLGLAYSLGATEPIDSIRPSPDGKYLAIGYEGGELVVLNPDEPSILPIYSKSLIGEGFAWSPDGSLLAAIEKRSAGAYELFSVDVTEDALGDGAPERLLTSEHWMGAPAWISPDAIFYLSTQSSRAVAVWKLDLITGQAASFFEPNSDVTGLWSVGDGERILARTAGAQGDELWVISEGQAAVRIQLGEDEGPASIPHVSVAPNGLASATKVCFVRVERDSAELVVIDLDRDSSLVLLPLEFEVQSIAMQTGAMQTGAMRGDGDVLLAATDGGLYQFAARSPVLRYQEPKRLLSRPIRWHGLGFSQPFTMGSRGIGAAVDRRLVVIEESFRDLDAGAVQARDPRDLLELARRWAEAGDLRRSRSTVKRLWEELDASAEVRREIALEGARIEKLRGKARGAEKWIDRALEASPPPDADRTAMWLEKLLLAFLDRRDEKGSAKILLTMPHVARSEPLALWIRDLLIPENKRTRKNWQKIGRSIRREEWEDAAWGIGDSIGENPDSEMRISALHEAGLAFAITGAFEPLASIGLESAAAHTKLMSAPRLQRRVLDRYRDGIPGRISRDELRGRLLLDWAKAGEIDAAIALVLADLRDPKGSIFDYADLFEQYLEAEEQELWMERAVDQILLAPRVYPVLSREMENLGQTPLFSLASAKRSIIQGDVWGLADELAQLAEGAAEGSASEEASLAANHRLLTHVYRAKYRERTEAWDAALASYADALEVLDDYPRDWGVLPFEVAWSMDLLRAGEGEAQGLRDLLQIVRGLGDPLVNPAHEVATMQAGVSGLQAMEILYIDGPLAPFIQYLQAVLQEEMGHPYRALASLREAEASAGEFGGLRRRILIEEAAIRSSLGQHRLALGRLEALDAADLSASELTALIQFRAQEEVIAGMAQTLESRVRYLCSAFGLPTRWVQTLIPEHAVLTARDGRQSRPRP